MLSWTGTHPCPCWTGSSFGPSRTELGVLDTDVIHYGRDWRENMSNGQWSPLRLGEKSTVSRVEGQDMEDRRQDRVQSWIRVVSLRVVRAVWQQKEKKIQLIEISSTSGLTTGGPHAAGAFCLVSPSSHLGKEPPGVAAGAKTLGSIPFVDISPHLPSLLPPPTTGPRTASLPPGLKLPGFQQLGSTSPIFGRWYGDLVGEWTGAAAETPGSLARQWGLVR